MNCKTWQIRKKFECIFIIAAICLKLNLKKYDEDLQSGFACTQYVHLFITRHIARVNRHIFSHNQQQSALFQKWRLLKYLLRRHACAVSQLDYF
jgi:hypothetical protein